MSSHSNLHLSLLYVHSNISVIRLVVISQVNSHSITGHQGLPSVHAKLTNTILDAYTPSCVCYRPCGDKQKNVKFLPCHRGFSCVHMMHHSTNKDAQTHSWNQCGPSDIKNDMFCQPSKILQGVCPYGTYNIAYTFVCTFQYKRNTPCGDLSGKFTFNYWSSRAAQCPCQTHQYNCGCIHTILCVLLASG